MEIRPKNSSESPTSWSGVEIPEFFLSLWSVVVLEKDIYVMGISESAFSFAIPKTKENAVALKTKKKTAKGIAQERH